MNKMENPKMTVVKFGVEDVIATSSYSVLGKEIKQFSSAIDTSLYSDDGLYEMNVTGPLSNGAYTFGTTEYNKNDAPYVYAWYEDTTYAWTSENKLPKNYSSDLPE